MASERTFLNEIERKGILKKSRRRGLFSQPSEMSLEMCER
jgi:ribosomal protein S21